MLLRPFEETQRRYVGGWVLIFELKLDENMGQRNENFPVVAYTIPANAFVDGLFVN